MYVSFVKRFFDIILSLFGIAVLLVPSLIIALIIKLSDGGSVFFVQERVGKNKKLFKLYKFRSMKTDTPKNVPTHLMTDPEQYITKIGRFIRRTSLDEVPQLLNILSGKMSIVGPRPALPVQEDLLAERDKYGANDIKPGLTGLAQINGRDELETSIKAKYDGEYVKKVNFLFDCKCLFGTVLPVLRGTGVREGCADKNKAADSAGMTSELSETDPVRDFEQKTLGPDVSVSGSEKEEA